MPDDPLPIPLAPFNTHLVAIEYTQTLCRVSVERLQAPAGQPMGRYDPPMRSGVMENQPCRAFDPLPNAWYENNGPDPYQTPGPRGDPAITPGGIYNNTGPPIPLENFRPKVPTYEEMPHVRDPPMMGRLEMPPLLHRHEDLFPRHETPAFEYKPPKLFDPSELIPKREHVEIKPFNMLDYLPKPEPVRIETKELGFNIHEFMESKKRETARELEALTRAEPEKSGYNMIDLLPKPDPVQTLPGFTSKKRETTFDMSVFRAEPAPSYNMLDISPKRPETPAFEYKPPKLFDMSELVPKRETKPFEYKPPEPVEIPKPYIPKIEWKPPQVFGLEGPGEARRIGSEVEVSRLDFGHRSSPFPHVNVARYPLGDDGLVTSTKPRRSFTDPHEPLVPQLPKPWWDK